MEVKIKKFRNNAVIPNKATTGSAGFDLYADIDKTVIFEANTSVVIPTGIGIEIPQGYVGLIFSRSGLAIKHNISLANTVGVIDSDYRGEIIVPLNNFGRLEYKISVGERIAQILIMPVMDVDMVLVEQLSESTRGDNGFGSSGKL